eukprot:gene20796-27629_t
MSGFVVSLRSRGLASFSKSKFLDFRYHSLCFAHEILDVFMSLFLTWYTLSWSGWISFVILAIVVTRDMDFAAGTVELSSFNETVGNRTFFYTNIQVQQSSAAASLALLLPLFTFVILPVLILLSITFKRRELASVQLGTVKAVAVSLCLSATALKDYGSAGAGSGGEVLKKGVYRLMDNLHKYLQHHRPYATHFYLPYLSDTTKGSSALYKISHDLGMLLRQVHRSVKYVHEAVQNLHTGGVSEVIVSDMVTKLSPASGMIYTTYPALVTPSRFAVAPDHNTHRQTEFVAP